MRKLRELFELSGAISRLGQHFFGGSRGRNILNSIRRLTDLSAWARTQTIVLAGWMLVMEMGAGMAEGWRR